MCLEEHRNHRPTLCSTRPEAFTNNTFPVVVAFISVCTTVGMLAGLTNFRAAIFNNTGTIADEAQQHTTAMGIALLIFEYLIFLVTIRKYTPCCYLAFPALIFMLIQCNTSSLRCLSLAHSMVLLDIEGLTSPVCALTGFRSWSLVLLRTNFMQFMAFRWRHFRPPHHSPARVQIMISHTMRICHHSSYLTITTNAKEPGFGCRKELHSHMA